MLEKRKKITTGTCSGDSRSLMPYMALLGIMATKTEHSQLPTQQETLSDHRPLVVQSAITDTVDGGKFVF